MSYFKEIELCRFHEDFKGICVTVFELITTAQNRRRSEMPRKNKRYV